MTGPYVSHMDLVAGIDSMIRESSTVSRYLKFRSWIASSCPVGVLQSVALAPAALFIPNHGGDALPTKVYGAASELDSGDIAN